MQYKNGELNVKLGEVIDLELLKTGNGDLPNIERCNVAIENFEKIGIDDIKYIENISAIKNVSHYMYQGEYMKQPEKLEKMLEISKGEWNICISEPDNFPFSNIDCSKINLYFMNFSRTSIDAQDLTDNDVLALKKCCNIKRCRIIVSNPSELANERKKVDGIPNIEYLVRQTDLKRFTSEKTLSELFGPDIQWTLILENIKNLDTDSLEGLNNMNMCYGASSYPERNLDSVKAIKQKVIKLTRGLDKVDDFSKVAIICKKIAKSISYDYEINNKLQNNEGYEMLKNSQNLDGLLSGKTLCAGYSWILHSLCTSVGIKCKHIAGQCDTKHRWLQVKIDDKWYNLDLTWCIEDIRKGKIPRYFLVSDGKFGHEQYQMTTQDREVCEESYDESKVKEFFCGSRMYIRDNKKIIFKRTRGHVSVSKISSDKLKDIVKGRE